MRLKNYLPLLFSMHIFSSCSTMETQNATKPTFTPLVDEATALNKAQAIVSKMEVDEKLALIKGHRGFLTQGFEKYGIPSVYMTDATQGVHIRQDWLGDDISEYALEKSTAFPNALELTATWNPDIAHDYAQSIGEECRAAGIGILLGPGMNIYRNAQNGRNFEYFGEDPYLAAQMIERYVVGVQNTGVIATLKHFVANNTEHKRRASNTVVSERALHEIYTPAFKSGIDAGAMAVMTAYNQINGEWAGQSNYVINELLREQLGFKNLVMTDWWSVNDVEKVVRSGQDLEMPGGETMGELKSLLASNSVEISDIDRMCESILKVFFQMGFDQNTKSNEKDAIDYSRHEQVALQTAREGIVLLRNEDQILPLSKDQNILVVGRYVENTIFGGGSGEVEGYNHHSLLDALQSTFSNISYSKEPSDQEIQDADVVLISVGTFDYEGCDRHFSLQKSQEDLVQRVSGLHPKSIVVAHTGSGIQMNHWDRVKGIIYNWYPGQIGQVALAEILAGQTNPSGKLPMSIERDFKDSPAYGYISDSTHFMCDDEDFMNMNPEYNRWQYDMSIEDAPDNLYDVHYDEGIFVGYRWYEKNDISVMFPFGFGLSYTSFEVSGLKTVESTQAVQLSCTIKNTGGTSGAEVVQVYVGKEDSKVERAVKELKSFQKISLEAGEEKELTFVLDRDAFSYYDENTHAWQVEPGTYQIHVGTSVNAIADVVEINL